MLDHGVPGVPCFCKTCTFDLRPLLLGGIAVLPRPGSYGSYGFVGTDAGVPGRLLTPPGLGRPDLKDHSLRWCQLFVQGLYTSILAYVWDPAPTPGVCVRE